MMKNILIFLAAMAVFTNALLGCATVSSHMKLANRSTDSVPKDAFAFVAVKHTISPGECLESPGYELCQRMIGDLPPIVQKGSGSGMLVWAKKSPIFLTAAHVCLDDMPSIFNQDGIIMTIKKEIDIRVMNSTGNFMKTEIIKVNEQTDLCALKVPKMDTAPVKLAHEPPEIGDTVYAVSAPHGIFKPTMTLVFSGHYSGYGDRWHYYTIPTRPGSSGSIVLDENFRAIGMLNAAFVHIEHIGLGAGYQEILEFVNSIDD